MDVLAWHTAVVRSATSYPGEAGLELALQLDCPVCHHRATPAFAYRLSPHAVIDGRARNGTPGDESWFKFSVDSRLGLERHCERCGTASIIPTAQRQALIELTDETLDTELLREAVEEMALVIEHVPETDHYRAHDVYRGGRLERITLIAWQQFGLDHSTVGTHRD